MKNYCLNHKEEKLRWEKQNRIQLKNNNPKGHILNTIKRSAKQRGLVFDLKEEGIFKIKKYYE